MPRPSRSCYLHCSCPTFRLALGNGVRVCVDVSSLSPCRFSAVLIGAGSCQIYPKIATLVQGVWNFFWINSSPYPKQPNALKKGSLGKTLYSALEAAAARGQTAVDTVAYLQQGWVSISPYPALWRLRRAYMWRSHSLVLPFEGQRVIVTGDVAGGPCKELLC